MTTPRLNIITGSRGLFEVSFIYIDGYQQYTEHTFFRASREKLGKEVRAHLHDFADEDVGEITWMFEDQVATKDDRGVDGFPRYLEVSAREIDTLEDLDIYEL